MSTDKYTNNMQLARELICNESIQELVYTAYGSVAKADKFGVLDEYAQKYKDKLGILCNEEVYKLAMLISKKSNAYNQCAKQYEYLGEMFSSTESVMNIINKLNSIVNYNKDKIEYTEKFTELMGLSCDDLIANKQNNTESTTDEIDDIDELFKMLGIDASENTEEPLFNIEGINESENTEEPFVAGTTDNESENTDTDAYDNNGTSENTEDSSTEDNIESKKVQENSYSTSLGKIDKDNYELNGERETVDDDDGIGCNDIKQYTKDDLENYKAMAEKQQAITGMDESATDLEEEDDIDISDVGHVEDIDEVISAILNRNEGVFRSCLELDRPYGMLYEKGLLSYGIKNGKLQLHGGVGKGRSVFENLYRAIINGAGTTLENAPNIRNSPNADNISNMSCTYYPGYMFKYSLGFVDKVRYTSWSKFESAVKELLYKRLKMLYKKDLFFDNIDKIEKIYSTAILVISYEGGTGIKLRVSLPGVTIDPRKLEESIRSVTTYKSAGITITQVKGYLDVVDVQVYLQEDKFLDRPYWAYKAMKLKLDNGEKVSLTEGLPIGRKVNGDIVDFKLDPSNRFLTFLAAGSGAGKGVLTLSLVAAAVGSGIPLFYLDYKPDMASIFFAIERHFSNEETGYKSKVFAYDGIVLRRDNSDDPKHILGYGMPQSVKKHLGKYSGAILYLKSVQLMCAMAQYRADHGAKDPIMFVFDETQAMQRLIKNAVEKTAELNKEHTPKKTKGVTEEPDEIYQYTSVLIEWFKEVNLNIDTYVNTTGRKSNTFCIFIAQSPDYSTWTNLKASLSKVGGGTLELLSRITFADTIFKILGRGSTTSKYGLGGDAKKSVTEKELQYVANNRFFGMYDGKTTDGASITIFKPFLTLNSDDPYDVCWTGGMGKKFGYGAVKKEEYEANIKLEHPGEPGYSNKYGIHTGTGLLGLTSMYCNGDQDRVKNNFESSWKYCIEWFDMTGLSAKYSNPSDYMYDASLDGLMMLESMIRYSPEKENSVRLGYSTGSSSGNYEIEEVDTGLSMNDTDVPPQAHTQKTTSNIPNTANQQNSQGTTQTYKTDTEREEEEAFKAFQESQRQNESIPAPAESRPAESRPAESRPAESRPAESRPAESVVNPDIQKEADKAIENILGDAPEGVDVSEYVKQSLEDDVKQGFVSKEAAEIIRQRFNLNNNTANETVQQKVFVDNTGTPSTSSTGRDEKVINIDTTQTKNFSPLNDTNSIDCRRSLPVEPKFYQRVMLKTFWGNEKYTKDIWKSILSDIKYQGYNTALITRVSLYGEQMYVNGKIVRLDGVLGGRQNIRLQHIVNYTIMFKKFPMIRELRLDTEMLQTAVAEFGENAIAKMFELGRKLNVVYIRQLDGNTQQITRQSVVSESSRNIQEKARMSNEIDLYCKTKRSKKMSEYTPGENIGALKLAKSSFSSAGNSFLDKNKPKLGTTLLYSGVGIVAGTLGLAWWGTVNGFKMLKNLGNSFKQ